MKGKTKNKHASIYSARCDISSRAASCFSERESAVLNHKESLLTKTDAIQTKRWPSHFTVGMGMHLFWEIRFENAEHQKGTDNLRLFPHGLLEVQAVKSADWTEAQITWINILVKEYPLERGLDSIPFQSAWGKMSSQILRLHFHCPSLNLFAAFCRVSKKKLCHPF